MCTLDFSEHSAGALVIYLFASLIHMWITDYLTLAVKEHHDVRVFPPVFTFIRNQ